jgi:hypothetical protein
MGVTFTQSGNLTGGVNAAGTLRGAITSQGKLQGALTSERTLQGTVATVGTLQATMTSEGTLQGSISMPEKVVIEKTGNTPKIGEVTLLSSAWISKDNLHYQVVEIEGVTENSQVDLTPSVEQLLIFYEKDLSFVTENENGIVTVYAIGQKPTNDYTIQVTITEVSV